MSPYYSTTTVLYTSYGTNSFDKRPHLGDYCLGAEKKSTPSEKNPTPGAFTFPSFLVYEQFLDWLTIQSAGLSLRQRKLFTSITREFERQS